MEYLLTSNNLIKLKLLANANTLYGFDYDGTLARITDDPSLSHMSIDTSSLLCKLNNQVKLAIITGRSLSDIQGRIGFTPAYLVGNHGAEGLHALNDFDLTFQKLQSFKEKMLSQCGEMFHALGIFVEDKGLSLTLHYRNSKLPDLAKQYLENQIPHSEGFRFSPGKMILNITHDSNFTKGMAFQKMLNIENSDFGFFVGDDQTDEDVFGLELANVFTVRVGYHKDSQAQFFLKDQSEVVFLLNFLIAFHQKEI